MTSDQVLHDQAEALVDEAWSRLKEMGATDKEAENVLHEMVDRI